jgi:hypothetical protein
MMRRDKEQAHAVTRARVVGDGVEGAARRDAWALRR